MIVVPLLRISIFIFCLCTLSVAQEKATLNVAVIPFAGDNTVSKDQLDFITSKLSGELIATKAFKILDRGKMDFILQEQGFQQTGACNTSECKVQMGQLLGVDKLVAGKMVRFGSSYAMHLELIDVGSGEIEKTVDVKEVGELEEVYEPLCQDAAGKLAAPFSVMSQTMEKFESVPMVETPAKKEVPADAKPKANSKPMSTKRKVALALWSTSILGAGGAYYFNSKGTEYQSDYWDAREAHNSEDTQTAYDRTQSADRNRSFSYGVSIGSLVVGVVLWFWPEGK